MIRKLDVINDFVATGRIKLGMTRKDMQALLGPAEKEGGTSRKYRLPSVYLYGDVQFVFPQARTVADCEIQGLRCIYVEDSLDELKEPLFLLS